jgi:peptidoglycan/LPS O-acetylase OafA/YrhL
MEPYSFAWWFIYISPFFRIFDYVIGFIFGLIYLSIKNKIHDSKKTVVVFTVLEIVSVLLFYVMFKSPILQIDSLRYGIFYVPLSVLLIFVFAFEKGMVSKMISLQPLVHLGKLSFIIYMIHQLMISYVLIILGTPMFNPEKKLVNNFKVAIFLFIIILCISDVLNRYLIQKINNKYMSKNIN